ncbi:DUF6082 family protein [Streptomyces sp. KLOTTS4A1]|uniref:DUF6082 family protein n=1 Tax=Streptomyces sp. KLOTTS4A1 TaxID=3390996 RepID=UPI0039F556E6
MATKSCLALRYVTAIVAGFAAGASALRHQQGTAPVCDHAVFAESRRRDARAHQQRMHWELLSKAIDDPSLAVVIDNYRVELCPEKRRQMIYANLWYVNALHLHTSGLLTKRELFGHLRELFQSPYIREYWELTRDHRLALDPSSEEAQIGQMAEELFQELQDGDGDWFVVGVPPPD